MDPAAALYEALGGWPAPLEWRAETISTNDDVRQLAQKGAPPWTVVFAGRQTAGRGRQGRAWRSEAGNLFMSVLLRPPVGATWVALVPLAAGVAACDAARGAGVDARLKWPNDVLVGDRKLAGVLAEAQSWAGFIDALVVGVGMNVGPVDEEARATTTSLAEAGATPGLAPVAASVLRGLRGWYDALAQEARRAEVVTAWRERSVSWWGREVEVTCGSERLRGRAVDIDADGALLLDTGHGRRRVVAGDARELRPAEA